MLAAQALTVSAVSDAGVTDFVAVEFHTDGPVADDTRSLLKSLV